jgi:2-dehydropantoate 2-reductase
MWEKFIFISALASATSYLNQNMEIINSRSSRAIYVELLNEITMLAAVKLSLPNDIVMQTIHKLEKTPKNFIDASGRFGWSKI